MALTFRSAAHSEVGLVRRNNQDSAYVSPRLVLVADGMGGAAAGDLASAVAVDVVAGADATWPHPLPAAELLGACAQVVTEANDDLRLHIDGDPRLEGMGTTLCGFALGSDGAVVLNIGDSRAYLLRDGALSRVTRDHSWVQTLVDAGRITEAEALVHPQRSLIMRVLNGQPTHSPDLDLVELRADDRLLVCSDGLCGLVTDAQIAAELGAADREDAVGALTRLARDAGGYDNITIIVTDVTEGEDTDGVRLLGAAETRIVAAPAASEVVREVAPTAPAASAPRRLAEQERYAPVARRSAPLRAVALIVAPLLLLGGGAYGWYSYTQTRFYVAPAATHAGLYQGVPDQLLGRPLSRLVEDSTVPLADLPQAYADKVRATYAVDDLTAGRASLAELRRLADSCRAVRAARTASPSPSPSPSASATRTPTGSLTPLTPLPRPTGLVTGSLTASTPPTVSSTPPLAPVATPEDC